jgi:hypothetical protein
MQTTFNAERVIKWVNICQCLKKYGLHNPLKPMELLMEMSKLGPANIFGAIFGPSLSNELWGPDSNRLVMEIGLPVAQEIATLLDGTAPIAWDSVRTALGSGVNPRWIKWVENQRKNKENEKMPENPFADPELLKDPEYQRQAIEQLTQAIRDELDKPLAP